MTMPTWVTQLVSYSPFLAFVALATAIAYPHNRLINRWLWLAPIVLLILIQLVPAGIVIAYKLVTPDAERDILITRQLVEAMRGCKPLPSPWSSPRLPSLPPTVSHERKPSP